MYQDHIIKEVRKVRREIEEELGNDFSKILYAPSTISA